MLIGTKMKHLELQNSKAEKDIFQDLYTSSTVHFWNLYVNTSLSQESQQHQVHHRHVSLPLSPTISQVRGQSQGLKH